VGGSKYTLFCCGLSFDIKKNLPIPYEKSYNCSAITFYWTFEEKKENIETLPRGT
jgi:hypothetical protein